MNNCSCEYCGKRFYKRPSRIKRCAHNYCSSNCYHAAPLDPEDKRLLPSPRSSEIARKMGLANRKQWPFRQCPICETVYQITARTQHNKTCGNTKCAFALRSARYHAQAHYRWKGGTASHWSRQAKKVVSAQSCQWCGVGKKRAVGGLHIHHKDKNRKNNRPENLICLCGSCHIKHHRKIEKAESRTFAG